MYSRHYINNVLYISLTCGIIAGAAKSPVIQAGGVAPYLPIHTSYVLDNEIERLVTLANIPKLTKPYNLATIYYYLETIDHSHPKLYRRLNNALKQYEKKLSLTHKSAAMSVNDGETQLVNNNGVNSEQNYRSILRGQWQIQNWLGLYLGADITQDEHQATGSTLSIGSSWAQIDLGYKEHWFGPFMGASQLISNNAQTMPSVSLGNNLPIDLFGRAFNYQLFVAEMSSQSVSYNNEFSDTNNPYLAGLHLSFQPYKSWTIGASQTSQFSGGERPFNTRHIIDAFINPSKSDNQNDTGNNSNIVMTSISSKIQIDIVQPIALNIEYANQKYDLDSNVQIDTGSSLFTGSDTDAFLAGIYIPYLFNDAVSLTYEYSQWQDGWYISPDYSNGYSHSDYYIGHWAVPYTNLPAETQHTIPENSLSTKGNSHYLSSIWQLNNSHIVSSQVRTTKYNNKKNNEINNTWEIGISYSIALNKKVFTIKGLTGTNYLDKNYSTVGIQLEF